MTTTISDQDTKTMPIVLTIAGSDSSGGAGIQADIKTMSALGVYSASVITAITAQNTQGVLAIHDVPLDVIGAQLDAVLSDLNVQAIKIGMLSQADTIHLVADKLVQYDCQHIVFDPVMVATSGDSLLHGGSVNVAVNVFKEKLIPLSQVMTPNLHEAAILTGNELVKNQADMLATAQELALLGSQAVLLKGGHLEGDESCDLLFDCINNEHHFLPSTRIKTHNTHGTGCTLSSAIASYLAKGESVLSASQQAKQYIHQAISHANELAIGQGSGPVHHFFED